MESNTAFKALFEHSSVGIIISDQEGVIRRANPFVAKMFGYEVEELVDKKIEILLPMTLRKKHVGLRDNYNERPSPRAMGKSLDLKALRKDGSEFPVEISLSFYEIDNQRQIVSFINDITERKESEDALRRLTLELELKVDERTQELSQALIELGHINESLSKEIDLRKELESQALRALEKERELSEMKSRFVSMASHEFRTPLSGILTSASLIGKYKSIEHEEKREKHVHTIKKSVKNLTSILNDFLSLDKLDQGRMGATPSSFAVKETISTIIGELGDVLEDKQNIEFQSHEDDFNLYQDKDMFRNLLVNLLSNAIKYSPPEGPIKVSLERIGSRVKISVADKGVGIPENEQKHIFTRFFRAHNVSTIQGTGLGLNIVKRYLDLMEGDIEFTSQENVGTTFTITIPMELEDEKDFTN